jgi:hypothetical protein
MGGNINVNVTGTLASNDGMFKAKIESVAGQSMRMGNLKQIGDSRYASKTA